MTKNSYLVRHKEQRTSYDADQVEIQAIRLGAVSISSGTRDDVIADALDDFDRVSSVDEEDWQKQDNKIEDAIGTTHEEIEFRKEILGDLYPFQIRNGSLVYNKLDDLIYEYTLCITQTISLTEGIYVLLPRSFERLAACVCAAFAGPSAKYHHTGEPRDGNKKFKESILEVCDKTGELEWKPTNGLPAEGPLKGDEGLDFVIWKDYNCGRQIGLHYLIGQCACGNDWPKKYSDISLKKIGKWFGGQFSSVDPVKLFAVPFVIVPENLKQASLDAGLVFDRIRLVKAASMANQYVRTEWQELFLEVIDMVSQNKAPK